MARKIIQIAHAISGDERGETVVLCDDGGELQKNGVINGCLGFI